MKTAAWVWLTAGVLALGLNGLYQDGGAAWVHQAVDEVRGRAAQGSEMLADLATGQIDRFMTRANILQARTQTTASCRTSVAMATVQRRMARTQDPFAEVEAMSARQQAALTRMESRRAYMEAKFADFRMTPVAYVDSEPACKHVVVHVPAVHVNVPAMHVDVPAVIVNVPRIKVDVPTLHLDIPQVHVDVPAVHVSVPQVTVHQPAVHIDVPDVNVETSETSAPI